jgi:hypothetical protein
MRKRKPNDYKSINPDPKTVRDEINRKRIVENHQLVDSTVFKKSKAEKLLLKIAKAKSKASV